ncbi:GTP pyrophosphokinase family protein [Gemella sp. GH3]|uniref:GTP pyrophosphokinase n=1 Tax=unclassified Gemella TaxID=2624949 RepID=UPI0015D0049A|nr:MULTISPECIES: GTP pyrophosphokinase family protein [unclassified Gemella]MBF0714180.1 GTP pyrophosphokinase family protein [Gemella sp. GH3.1]NYS51132.1 GTP pyrophosphokinase family protein [Gemella sp. GH3]
MNIDKNQLALNFEKNATTKIKDILDTVIDYKDMMLAYDCAIKEIETKLDILNSEFKVRHQRNPISSIQTRLKSTISIFDKVDRKGISLDRESIEEYIEDIAGVRVICNYIDDIYKIATALIRQNDVQLIHKKDYIKDPKSNGYRSLHLIVKIPVFFADTTKNVKVEIQIRTIAMDFWASLEHQMKYKKVQLDDDNFISKDLKECAEIISKTDIKMQHIREEIDKLKSNSNEEDELLEKLKKIDFSIL